METLAREFDLIIMDHPHTALAATEGLFLSYEDWVPAEFLADQAANSVGRSHQSYRFGGRQWTLASDAATPIATWREDLMERHGLVLPSDWKEVLDLAARGFVTVSAFPIDMLMHSYMFCAALGEEPFACEHGVASDEVLASALAELRKLTAICDPACLERNPIRTAEWMTSTDDPRAAYCPFAYGYSNYSRPGYAPRVLKAGGLVSLDGKRLRSTLGGAGIAVSSRTRHPRVCMDIAMFMASPEVQKGVYFQAGGQPGHRAAWTDAGVNASCGGFFSGTLSTLDEALLRPQFPGYMAFQDAATPVAHACSAGKTSAADAAREINRLYRHHLNQAGTP
jgi:multiple sugar transport system substrate-binding protein